MSEDAGSRIGRIVVLGLLTIATLGFGLASLCGAVFTAVALPELGGSGGGGGGGSFAVAMLIVSVPSLLIGGGLAGWCGYKLVKRLRRQP